jgi:hypothetical protein
MRGLDLRIPLGGSVPTRWDGRDKPGHDQTKLFPAKGQQMSRFGFHGLVAAVIALALTSFSPAAARADSGTVRISFIKAGWVIGGTIGSGTLTFRR